MDLVYRPYDFFTQINGQFLPAHNAANTGRNGGANFVVHKIERRRGDPASEAGLRGLTCYMTYSWRRYASLDMNSQNRPIRPGLPGLLLIWSLYM